MRAVCQRVTGARVRVDGAVEGVVAGEIGAGLCVLLGVRRGDDPGAAERVAGKVARLRVFDGMDRSLLDTGGGALVVSQFTLYGDVRKGNRPSFSEAAPPEEAEPLYERFCDALRALGVPVATGVFGASMQVELVNDGPVTILVDG
jgi:D-tyrosyl-tRNA(Tyr) deacylase